VTNNPLIIIAIFLFSFTLKIQSQVSCNAAFYLSISVNNKLCVYFTNTSTPDVPGSTSYLWEFGDGDSSTIKNPIHFYPGSGTYPIKLTMFNYGLNSCTDTAMYNLLILPNGTTSINENINPLITLTNYPNPIAEKTTISYTLEKEADIEISVFDILGKKIESIDNGIKPIGRHKIVWDASSVTSGIYFIQLKTGNQTINKKVIISK